MKSLSVGRLVAIGLGAYLVFLLATFPADRALRWFAPEGLQTGVVRGTIWHGEASALKLDNHLLGATDWELAPSRLLLGRLQADVTTRYLDGSVEATLARSVFGKTIYVNDLQGVVPLGLLGKLQQVNVQNFEGKLGLQLASLTLRDGWPSDIDGTITVGELKLVRPVPQSLGSFEVVCSKADDGGVRGDLQDLAGVLSATGSIELTAERAYALNLSLAPKPDAPREIGQALQFLGQRDAEGRYQLAHSGQL